jgi:hypothetical protein
MILYITYIEIDLLTTAIPQIGGLRDGSLVNLARFSWTLDPKKIGDFIMKHLGFSTKKIMVDIFTYNAYIYMIKYIYIHI